MRIIVMMATGAMKMLTVIKGYGDAAVVFQRDWNLNPQSLPFAENIKPQSLRLLCQKGLFHHGYQQEILVQVSYHNDED